MDEIRKRFDQLEHKGISVKACIAELIGTATFVLLGCSVAIFTGHYQTGPLHTGADPLPALRRRVRVACASLRAWHAACKSASVALSRGDAASAPAAARTGTNEP